MSHLSHKITLACSCLLLAAFPAMAQQRGPGLAGVPVERRAAADSAEPGATVADSVVYRAVDSAVAEAADPMAFKAVGAADGVDTATAVAAVPFGPGERATYQVRVGLLGGVGNGTMEVVGVEDVRGHSTYNLRLTMQGGVPFYKVDTRFESWLDISKLVSRRFEQDQKEGKYKRHRIFEFFPEEMRWERLNTDQAGELPTELPLDDVSFLYFVRTLPLEVGQTYTFPRYFKEDGNPVVLKVLRKERVTVPVGTFETIVVQPIIKTSGLFGDGGKAEVYFTDDDQRILVQMKSKVPVLRSLNLVLESYVPGKQVAGAGVAAAGAVDGGVMMGGGVAGDDVVSGGIENGTVAAGDKADGDMVGAEVVGGDAAGGNAADGGVAGGNE